jgi:foldase protein PrsA
MSHIRFSFLFPVLLIGLVAAGCGGGGGGTLSGDAVAKVGNVTITKPQFDSLISRAQQSYKTQNQPFPKVGTADYDRIKSQAVDFLVQRAEFAQEAQKMGITISQKDIDTKLSQIKKQYFKGDEKAYLAQLKKQGLTQDEVDSDIKDQLISTKLFDKVTSGVTVTSKEIADYYKSHIKTYQRPEERTVRHILISVCGPNTPGGVKCRSDAAAKAFADKLYNQLQGGANFAALAKKYSGDTGSAQMGGKLTITRGQTVPTFDQTAFLLGVGTISHPVKTTYGYHIIEPISKTKPASTTPLSQVQAAIKQTLLQQRKQEKMAKWVNDIKKQFDVKYGKGFTPVSTTSTSTGSSTVPATTAATTTG